MGKLKIALYWCSSCGGCEESVVDLAELILAVTRAVEIVFWPAVMDFKYDDLTALEDGELACCFINGAITMDEQEEVAKLLRKKSKLVIAHGACAQSGGVVGLATFHTHNNLLKAAYQDAASLNNPGGILPETESLESGKTLRLPNLYNTVKTLADVLDVDYYLPGCPPTPEVVFNALTAVLEGTLPRKGSVLSDSRALCDSCSRRDSKPERLLIRQFKRTYEIDIDPEKCFLQQGLICMGPATRGGCKERCIKGNMPCRGCFGPLDHTIDQGTKYLSMLASIMGIDDENEAQTLIDSIPDPAGLFYRYSLATSAITGRK